MHTIRKAELADLKQLSALFNSYRIFYKKPDDPAGSEAFLEERISKNESAVFVCENEGQLTGFVQLYPLFSSTRMKRFWLLNDLFVHPDFRQQGIAELLIERSKKLCIDSDACGMMLETEKTNMPGNNLYPKMGFVLEKNHNFYNWDV